MEEGEEAQVRSMWLSNEFSIKIKPKKKQYRKQKLVPSANVVYKKVAQTWRDLSQKG